VSERRTYTVAEFAELLGVGRQTVYDACARGELRHVRMGTRIVIPRNVVAELGLES
jgi:excisionase family DNA binding protein